MQGIFNPLTVTPQLFGGNRASGYLPVARLPRVWQAGNQRLSLRLRDYPLTLSKMSHRHTLSQIVTHFTPVVNNFHLFLFIKTILYIKELIEL